MVCTERSAAAAGPRRDLRVGQRALRGPSFFMHSLLAPASKGSYALPRRIGGVSGVGGAVSVVAGISAGAHDGGAGTGVSRIWLGLPAFGSAAACRQRISRRAVGGAAVPQGAAPRLPPFSAALVCGGGATPACLRGLLLRSLAVGGKPSAAGAAAGARARGGGAPAALDRPPAAGVRCSLLRLLWSRSRARPGGGAHRLGRGRRRGGEGDRGGGAAASSGGGRGRRGCG